VIVILLIGLVLLATAVALVARGLMESRLRTADNLVNIGHYGFAGVPELTPTGGQPPRQRTSPITTRNRIEITNP